MRLSQSVDTLLENIELFSESVQDVLFQCSDGQVGFHQSLLALMSPFLSSILSSISCSSSSSISSFSSGEPLVIILDGVKTKDIQTLKTCIFRGSANTTKFTLKSQTQNGDIEEVFQLLGLKERPLPSHWQPWQKEKEIEDEKEKPTGNEKREIEALIEAEEIRLTKIVMVKMDEIMNGGKGIRCSECDKILSTHRILPHYKKHIDLVPKKYSKKKGGRPKKDKDKLKKKEKLEDKVIPSPTFVIKHSEKIKKVPKKRGRKRLIGGPDDEVKIAPLPPPQIKLSFNLEDVGLSNGDNVKEINLQELGKKKRGRKRKTDVDVNPSIDSVSKVQKVSHPDPSIDSLNKVQKISHPESMMPINMTKKELDVKEAKQEFDHFSAANGAAISFPEYLKHVYSKENSGMSADSVGGDKKVGATEVENGCYASGSSSASSVNEDYDESESDGENALVMDLQED